MTPSGRATDIIKDITTNGTASIIAIVGLYWIKQMVEAGTITGEAGMVVFVGTISAAVAYLFNAASSRQATRAFVQGLNTPTPGSEGTTVTGDNPTVQSGGPTFTVPTDTKNAP